jgi:hypothetical protein
LDFFGGLERDWRGNIILDKEKPMGFDQDQQAQAKVTNMFGNIKLNAPEEVKDNNDSGQEGANNSTRGKKDFTSRLRAPEKIRGGRGQSHDDQNLQSHDDNKPKGVNTLNLPVLKKNGSGRRNSARTGNHGGKLQTPREVELEELKNERDLDRAEEEELTLLKSNNGKPLNMFQNNRLKMIRREMDKK